MPMANHEREEQLFHSCLELPPAEQGAYLERACQGDAQLRRRIEQLVAAHQRAEEATLNPVLDVLGTVPSHELAAGEEEGPPAGRAGDTVGPYRLMRLLAEGGMGSVWLAERNDQIVNRPIALKLPRGAWPRAGLAARMAREREILAAFSHANIARLYDAGFTSEGQPYLALEYVEGRRIDEHCRDKGLDLTARLGLFLQVANAVAYAHAKLIVHRDLKPANILVTEDGQVRLLDFGIAKLLEEGRTRETEITKLGGRAFTLDYASPEQIAGEPITIGSDVYSLGVVLYELLTGVRPYKPARDSWGALEEAILNADPATPSEAAGGPFPRALRGDLDTIVLKALKKKPPERYATVNALVEDIERYLQGRPVLAQPDRPWYRVRKFMARNRLAAGAAAAVAVALLAGTGVSVWQARAALAEKERAEEVKEFIASIFKDADPYVGAGQALSAVDLLKQAKERIDRSFDERPELRVELLNLVGSSLLNLQDTTAADAVLSQVVDDAQRALGADHPQTLHARVLLTSVHQFRGRTDEMRAELDRLLPLLRAKAEVPAEDLQIVLRNRAHLAIDEGNYAAAESAAKEALAFSMARLGERHPETVGDAILLALSYHFGGKPGPALEAAERAFRWTTDFYRGKPKHPTVIDARSTYSRALAEVGQLDRATAELTQATRDAMEVFGPSSMQVGFFSGRLAGHALALGDIREALVNGERTVQILAEHAAPDSSTYATALRNRGNALLAARRAKEALPDLSRALEILKQRRGSTHDSTRSVQVNRALALAYVGRTDEARGEIESVLQHGAPDQASTTMALHVLGVAGRLAGDHREAQRLQQESLASIEEDPKAPWVRMRVLTEIGLNQVELGRDEEAASVAEKALDVFGQAQRVTTPERADALIALGRARMGLGKAAEALPPLEEADAFWRAFDADNRWAGDAALWLGRCYGALGRGGAAGHALARARKILARSLIPADAKLVRLAGVR